MINGTSVVATEVCRLRLEIPVLGSGGNMSAGLCRALGTCRCNCDQEGRYLTALEKRY